MHRHKGEYSKKHKGQRKLNEKIVKALREKEKDGEIPCAVAHQIAKELDVSPKEVGYTMDMLEIAIVKCQLGLFGYKPEKKIIKPAEKISEELKKEIEAELEDGKLSCKKAWEIAKRLGIGKMEVSSACEAMGIKIKECQLGAF